MAIMVTGGAGYIGSHAVKRLLADGHHVLAVDNMHQGHRRVVELCRQRGGERYSFLESDLNDRAALEQAMRRHRVDSVLHFGALALVGESVEVPLRYFRSNIAGTVSLLEACEACEISRLVFSSSCSIYGQPPEAMIPVPEHCPKAPMSPYALSKLIGEQLLADFAHSLKRRGMPFGYTCLRYFNVCGSDPETVFGEDHTPETHLIPNVILAALGRKPEIAIFGTDYPTPDGTCVRDYVHVEDLIDAHVLALSAIKPGSSEAYNLGIGKGYSVREIIGAVRQVSGREFKVVEHPRRAGDPPRLWADPRKIERELGWRARFTDLHEIIATAYRWFEKHPKGYPS